MKKIEKFCHICRINKLANSYTIFSQNECHSNEIIKKVSLKPPNNRPLNNKKFEDQKFYNNFKMDNW